MMTRKKLKSQITILCVGSERLVQAFPKSTEQDVAKHLKETYGMSASRRQFYDECHVEGYDDKMMMMTKMMTTTRRMTTRKRMMTRRRMMTRNRTTRRRTTRKRTTNSTLKGPGKRCCELPNV